MSCVLAPLDVFDVVALDAAASVEDVGGVVCDEVVVGVVVVGDDDDGVGLGEFVGGEVDAGDLVVKFVGSDPGIVHVDVGSEVKEFGDDASGGGFSGVVGVLFVGDAEDKDAAAVDRLLAVVEAELDPFGHMGGHVVVDLVGDFDKLGDGAEFSFELPGEIGGIDGKAVTADAWSGVEGHEPEGFGFGGVDDVPEVDAELAGVDGEFVDEGDVDVAEGVLEEFGQFGFFGSFGGEGAVDEVVVEGLHGLEGGLVDSGDDFGGALEVPGLVAGVDAFGGEAEVEVFA